jgi:hypothetical protein
MIKENKSIISFFSGCPNDPYSALNDLYFELKIIYNINILENIDNDFSGVVISNRPILKNFNGTIIYYLDDHDILLFKNLERFLNKRYFFTPSHYCSKLLHSTCKIESIVCPPCFDKEIIFGNKIAVDPYHPSLDQLRDSDLDLVLYPKKNEDFEGCKLFLNCSNNFFDIRYWWAQQHGCLAGGIKNKEVPEEFSPYYIEYQGGSWIKYCRKFLSDAPAIVAKIRKNTKKFDGCAMDENIKKALQQKPIRSEVVKSFAEIQQFAKNNSVSRKIIRQNISRDHNLKDKKPNILAKKEKKYLFWTGGIGDVLTLDSYISPEDRQEVLAFLYATHKQNTIKELFLKNSCYPNLTLHQTIWDDFKNRWCFYSKSEVISKLEPSQRLPYVLDSEDWSIANKFNEIRRGLHSFCGSSFLVPGNKLCDITQELPEKFCVICPFSTDKNIKNRDFISEDWRCLFGFLERRSIFGIVLYRGIDVVPSHKQIIDLSNKTTMLESVEILKKSIGYIGVDTCFSVLAAQLFEPQEICIKSINAHLYSNINIYYAPHTSFSFVHKDIGPGLKIMSLDK